MATKMYMYQTGNNFEIDFYSTNFDDAVEYINKEMIDWLDDLVKTNSLAEGYKLEIIWGSQEWDPTLPGSPTTNLGGRCRINFSHLNDAAAFKLTFLISTKPYGCIIVK